MPTPPDDHELPAPPAEGPPRPRLERQLLPLIPLPLEAVMLGLGLALAAASVGALVLVRRGALPAAADLTAGQPLLPFANAVNATLLALAPAALVVLPIFVVLLGNRQVVYARYCGRDGVVAATTAFFTVGTIAALALWVIAALTFGLGCLALPVRGMALAPAQGFLLKDTIILPSAGAPGRVLLAYVAACPMLLCLSAFGLAAGRLFGAERGPLAAALLYLTGYGVSQVPLLAALFQFLPLRYWHFWRLALLPEIPWAQLGAYAAVTVGYTLGFLGVALALAARHRSAPAPSAE